MIEEQLKNAGYELNLDPDNEEIYQKKVTDQWGIKYFISFYKNDYTKESSPNFTKYGESVGGLPLHGWQVNVQFRKEDKRVTLIANTSWTLEQNSQGIPVSSIEDVEEFYEDMFKLLKLDYYSLHANILD